MANRGLQAVIFDLDGLLVDSEPGWLRVRTEMFRRFGLEWTDIERETLKRPTSIGLNMSVMMKCIGKRKEIIHRSRNG
ncbi:MAG: HAD hydrolase-like protein [Bacteroidota bacterium]